jgi:hypothetical protein
MPDIDLSGPTFVSARRSSNFRGRVADDQTKRMVMRFPVAFALEGMLSNQNIILLKKAAPLVGHCAAPALAEIDFSAAVSSANDNRKTELRQAPCPQLLMNEMYAFRREESTGVRYQTLSARMQGCTN